MAQRRRLRSQWRGPRRVLTGFPFTKRSPSITLRAVRQQRAAHDPRTGLQGCSWGLMVETANTLAAVCIVDSATEVMSFESPFGPH